MGTRKKVMIAFGSLAIVATLSALPLIAEEAKETPAGVVEAKAACAVAAKPACGKAEGCGAAKANVEPKKARWWRRGAKAEAGCATAKPACNVEKPACDSEAKAEAGCATEKPAGATEKPAGACKPRKCK